MGLKISVRGIQLPYGQHELWFVKRFALSFNLSNSKTLLHFFTGHILWQIFMFSLVAPARIL